MEEILTRAITLVSEPFFVQKTDLIAELKRTKDIPGIKKLKVERAQVEKTQEQNLMSEISKAFNVTNFVDQVMGSNHNRANKNKKKTTESPMFFPHDVPTDPGKGQLGKCDTDLEAADAGAKGRGAREEGARGATSEGERGEAAESNPAVEATATRQKGQRGKEVRDLSIKFSSRVVRTLMENRGSINMGKKRFVVISDNFINITNLPG